MRKRRGSSSLLESIIVIAIIVGAAYLLHPEWFIGIIPQSAVKGEITVNYEDGSSHTYSGNIYNQAVAQAGSTTAISSIVFTVKATPSWQGSTPSSVGGVSWTGAGTVKVDGAQKQTISLLPNLPLTVTNGQVVTVSSTTIGSSTLNTWIPFDQNNHSLVFNEGVSMTFTPTGDVAKTIDGSCTSTLSLKNIGFPALLTVSVTTTVS